MSGKNRTVAPEDLPLPPVPPPSPTVEKAERSTPPPLPSRKPEEPTKAALCIGLNYDNTPDKLYGCVNDAMAVKELLELKGYSVALITDRRWPVTKKEVLSAILDLILHPTANRLHIHYSGHGTQVRDGKIGGVEKDEDDGYDECLCLSNNELVVDDELRALLTCLMPGKTLTCVLDCCHSGSGMDLKYELFERFATRGKKGSLAMLSNRRKGRGPASTHGKVIMLSGCQDNQTSADLWVSEVRESRGALSHAWLSAIDNPEVKSYGDLVHFCRKKMKELGSPQVPNLSSGNSKFSIDDTFAL